MSRIGLNPVEFPANVEIKVDDNNLVTVKGPKGEISQQVDKKFKIEIEDNNLVVSRPSESKEDKSKHGLYRSLINNMVVGVTEGYEKKLLIHGTGYRAEKNGKNLKLHLGFSHDLVLEDPEGIETEVPNQLEIIIRGCDKQKVGSYAAVIRSYREPEPYKGKGVKYEDEQIRRKVGKTGS